LVIRENKLLPLGKTYFAIQTRKQELTANEYTYISWRWKKIRSSS